MLVIQLARETGSSVIGGRKEEMEDTHYLYAGMLPTLESYESIEPATEAVIASVNGYAVEWREVLQVVVRSLLSRRKARFPQVGR